MNKAIIFFLSIFAVNGCTNLNQSEPQIKETYNCNEGSFWVAYSNDGKVVNLNFDIETVRLDLIPNDAFKEYSDQTTTFWPEGRNNVYVREDWASLYHNCIKIK